MSESRGVQDAEPGDVYVDAKGTLWRVIGSCHEPTVIVQSIENDSIAEAKRMSGGVSGVMWQGFTRIWRPSGSRVDR